MILSDIDIHRHIETGNSVAHIIDICPYNIDQLQPASYDLTLDNEFYEVGVSDYVIHTEEYLLHTRRFVLATTKETIQLPNDIVGQVHGKSSLGRIGLMVHVTAGLVDPGFRGTITLELYNVSPRTIKLVPGMRIAQITFQQLTSRVSRPYGHPQLHSKYQNQKGVTPSRGI